MTELTENQVKANFIKKSLVVDYRKSNTGKKKAANGKTMPFQSQHDILPIPLSNATLLIRSQHKL